MKILRPIAIVAASLMLTQAVFAQAPPAADKPAAKKEAPKEKKAPTAAKKQTPAASPAPTATPTPAPTTTQAPPSVFDDPNVDLVYGAYQRGMYKTAFDLAMNRAQYNGDPKAMTMLGELYANAMGVKRDLVKAAEWYKRAADAGAHRLR